MLRLSIQEIINKIEKEEIFNCVSEDNSFSLRISEYVPYVGAAIHNGENFRRSLRENCLLTKSERWYEEDPKTADFTNFLPIQIIGNDSRYEYDLNRSNADCVYKEAWGKKIWKTELTHQEIGVSKDKHSNFYLVVDALIGKLEKKFKACLVYDVHSYNYKRITNVEPPLFNLGTANVNKKFRPFVKDWLSRLEQIESDFFTNTTAENLVFQGHGNFLKHISKKFKNTLVLATEVRKSYCDEDTGDIFPEVVEDIRRGFKKAVLPNTQLFINKKTSENVKKKNELLSSNVEPIIKEIDKKLFELLKSFDMLEFVNPKNLESEKKKFFKSKFKKNPDFKYRPLDIDIPKFKKDIYSIPIHEIKDLALYTIYKGVIEAYCDQVEMLSYRGSKKFMYMSLKYFGEPSDDDLANAQYVLKLPKRLKDEAYKTDLEAKEDLLDEVKHYGFKGKVELSKNIPSFAVFSPNKKLLRLKSGMKFSEDKVKVLQHHEIGVHMLTTDNALRQELRVFELGLPVNTLTQEGLAIYSEFRAGLLTVERLRELGLRTSAIRHMLKNYDFKETFLYLVDRHGMSEDKAFYLTTRVYRGGGFTKDYLYLKGFSIMLDFFEKEKDVGPLLIGKTSIEYYPQLKELVDREIVQAPKTITRSFEFDKSEAMDSVLNYVLTGIIRPKT